MHCSFILRCTSFNRNMLGQLWDENELLLEAVMWSKIWNATCLFHRYICSFEPSIILSMSGSRVFLKNPRISHRISEQ